MNIVVGEEKSETKFWAPNPSGPNLRGPTLRAQKFSWFCLGAPPFAAPHPSAPILPFLWYTTFSGFGPPTPLGPHPSVFPLRARTLLGSSPGDPPPSLETTSRRPLPRDQETPLPHHPQEGMVRGVRSRAGGVWRRGSEGSKGRRGGLRGGFEGEEALRRGFEVPFPEVSQTLLPDVALSTLNINSMQLVMELTSRWMARFPSITEASRNGRPTMDGSDNVHEMHRHDEWREQHSNDKGCWTASGEVSDGSAWASPRWNEMQRLCCCQKRRKISSPTRLKHSCFWYSESLWYRCSRRASASSLKHPRPTHGVDK